MAFSAALVCLPSVALGVVVVNLRWLPPLERTTHLRNRQWSTLQQKMGWWLTEMLNIAENLSTSMRSSTWLAAPKILTPFKLTTAGLARSGYVDDRCESVHM